MILVTRESVTGDFVITGAIVTPDCCYSRLERLLCVW